MMRKLASGALVLLMLLTPAIVHADELYVQPVQQAMSNWCWAACAQMVGQFEEPGSTRTQYDVVQHVKGGLYNLTGTLAESVTGSEYVCYGISDFYSTASAFSLAQIGTMINVYGNPLSTACGVYNSQNQRVGGHMYVMTGVSGTNVKVIDPLDLSWEWVSYSTYCNGYDGRRYDQTVYTYN